MSATYELETDMIAVNAKRTRYMLMRARDLTKCGSNAAIKFCTLRSPIYIYDLGESRLCVTALLRQDKAAVTESCKTAVKLDTLLPQAVYIRDGNWVIIGTEKLVFTVMCLQLPLYQEESTPPIYRLKVASECEAYSDKIKLPPFYHAESQYGRIEQDESLLPLQNSSTFTLWRTFDNFSDIDMTTLTKLPELDEIQDISLDALATKLNQLRRTALQPNKSLWKHIWEYLEYICYNNPNCPVPDNLGALVEGL